MNGITFFDTKFIDDQSKQFCFGNLTDFFGFSYSIDYFIMSQSDFCNEKVQTFSESIQGLIREEKVENNNFNTKVSKESNLKTEINEIEMNEICEDSDDNDSFVSFVYEPAFIFAYRNEIPPKPSVYEFLIKNGPQRRDFTHTNISNSKINDHNHKSSKYDRGADHPFSKLSEIKSNFPNVKQL
eukprot:TRINITY_DN1485_c0_g1_i1.p1 TRINITY_DN1485_c0_g1~~TRINITY_DN1485_c0_g1_i1.p1  ORF type:complete len:184 (+),score=54.92 TRINITY_DN1485_c0_g1_i1:232-783(+)